MEYMTKQPARLLTEFMVRLMNDERSRDAVVKEIHERKRNDGVDDEQTAAKRTPPK